MQLLRIRSTRSHYLLRNTYLRGEGGEKTFARVSVDYTRTCVYAKAKFPLSQKEENLCFCSCSCCSFIFTKPLLIENLTYTLQLKY